MHNVHLGTEVHKYLTVIWLRIHLEWAWQDMEYSSQSQEIINFENNILGTGPSDIQKSVLNKISLVHDWKLNILETCTVISRVGPHRKKSNIETNFLKKKVLKKFASIWMQIAAADRSFTKLTYNRFIIYCRSSQ